MSEITQQQIDEAHDKKERLWMEVRICRQALANAESLLLGAEDALVKLQRDLLKQERERSSKPYPNGRYASIEKGGV